MVDSLPKRINNFISKQQVQKGWKGALAGGTLGALATGGNPIGTIGGAYLGHKFIGFGPRHKKGKLGIRAAKNQPSRTKYTAGSMHR